MEAKRIVKKISDYYGLEKNYEVVTFPGKEKMVWGLNLGSPIKNAKVVTSEEMKNSERYSKKK